MLAHTFKHVIVIGVFPIDLILLCNIIIFSREKLMYLKVADLWRIWSCPEQCCHK